ncbi:hypothetical protein K3495_g4285 [Podosphaera aphanis]|nr:hypothetical protein K3495_g4285 [Podosphaera aphanis]
MASHGVPRPKSVNPLSDKERSKELREIQEYKELETLIRVKVAEREYTTEVLDLTTKLLEKNPEYYTFWNIRRRLLIHGLFPQASESSENTVDTLATTNTSERSRASVPPTSSPNDPPKTLAKNHMVYNLINSDLEFLFSVMIKFPKCYWLWNYRAWLLQQANERLDPATSKSIWEHELSLVKNMLGRDKRNFHGWSYRRMVVAQLEKLSETSLVESEFAYTTKMTQEENAGLSNFSAWHRRSKLIPKLLEKRDADAATRHQFLEDEFDMIISAMCTDSYPYQQSTWFYYQFLMSSIIEPGEQPIFPDMTIPSRCEHIKEQINILNEMRDEAEDCKWIYNALIEYTRDLCKLEGRDLLPEENESCKTWLQELRKLDPFRKGRWDDLEKILK